MVVDTTKPTIDSIALSSDNARITVVFDEDVFNTDSGGDLDVNDFYLSISGGQALLSNSSNVRPTTVTKTSPTIYLLAISVTGIADGSEIIIEPDANSIYDKAGNIASTTQSNNTVTQMMRNCLLLMVTIATSNTFTTGANLGKEGDVITLTIVSNEDVTTPTVTFTSGGNNVTNAASVSGSSPGKNYQATYTVNALDTDGAVGFSIGDFTDGNTNTGNPVSTLTSGTTITIDKLLPTLTTVTYSTNNSSHYYSKVGDTITLNVSSSEIITAPTVAFSWVVQRIQHK